MFEYVPHFIPRSIHIVGVGGTGSRLVPLAVQLAKTCLRSHSNSGWLESLDINLIDGDIVEESNLTRQNFIARDVGHNKAIVLANRYSNAFGIPINPIPFFIKELEFEDDESTSPLPALNFNSSIVILALDSPEARRQVLQFITGNICEDSGLLGSTCFIIDAGNEDDFGQVRYFTTHPFYSEGGVPMIIPQTSPIKIKVPYIPMDVSLYENLGQSRDEISCNNLPQSLAINSMMASIACGVLQNFLYVKPMTYDTIYFSLKEGGSVGYNTPSRWYKRILDNGGPDKSFIGTSLPPDVFYSHTRSFIEETSKFLIKSGGNLELIKETDLVKKTTRKVKTPVDVPYTDLDF